MLLLEMSRVISRKSRTIIPRMSLTSGTIEILLKAELTGMGIEVRSISIEKMPMWI